jgi:WD40 repeat protein
VQANRKIKTLISSGKLESLAFNPDGKSLVTWQDRTALVWNLDAITDTLDTTKFLNSISRVFGKSPVQKLPSRFEPQFSSDGKKLLTYEEQRQEAPPSKNVLVTHSQNSEGQWQADHQVVLGFSEPLLMSPDGTKLAFDMGNFGDSGNIVGILDTATGKRLFELKLAPNTSFRKIRYLVKHIKFSRDGSKIFTSGSRPDERGTDKDVAIIWDANTGEPLNIIRDTERQDTALLIPSFDGHLLFTREFKGRAVLWGTNGTKLQDLPVAIDSYARMRVFSSPTRMQFITYEREHRTKQRILIWEPE